MYGQRNCLCLSCFHKLVPTQIMQKCSILTVGITTEYAYCGVYSDASNGNLVPCSIYLGLVHELLIINKIIILLVAQFHFSIQLFLNFLPFLSLFFPPISIFLIVNSVSLSCSFSSSFSLSLCVRLCHSLSVSPGHSSECSPSSLTGKD